MMIGFLFIIQGMAGCAWPQFISSTTQDHVPDYNRSFNRVCVNHFKATLVERIFKRMRFCIRRITAFAK